MKSFLNPSIFGSNQSDRYLQVMAHLLKSIIFNENRMESGGHRDGENKGRRKKKIARKIIFGF